MWTLTPEAERERRQAGLSEEPQLSPEEEVKYREISENPIFKASKLGLKATIHHLEHYMAHHPDWQGTSVFSRQLVLSPLNKLAFATSFVASFQDEVNKGETCRAAILHAFKHASVDFLTARALFAVPGVGIPLAVSEILTPVLEQGQQVIQDHLEKSYSDAAEINKATGFKGFLAKIGSGMAQTEMQKSLAASKMFTVPGRVSMNLKKAMRQGGHSVSNPSGRTLAGDVVRVAKWVHGRTRSGNPSPQPTGGKPTKTMPVGPKPEGRALMGDIKGLINWGGPTETSFSIPGVAQAAGFVPYFAGCNPQSSFPETVDNITPDTSKESGSLPYWQLGADFSEFGNLSHWKPGTHSFLPKDEARWMPDFSEGGGGGGGGSATDWSDFSPDKYLAPALTVDNGKSNLGSINANLKSIENRLSISSIPGYRRPPDNMFGGSPLSLPEGLHIGFTVNSNLQNTLSATVTISLTDPALWPVAAAGAVAISALQVVSRHYRNETKKVQGCLAKVHDHAVEIMGDHIPNLIQRYNEICDMQNPEEARQAFVDFDKKIDDELIFIRNKKGEDKDRSDKRGKPKVLKRYTKKMHKVYDREVVPNLETLKKTVSANLNVKKVQVELAKGNGASALVLCKTLLPSEVRTALENTAIDISSEDELKALISGDEYADYHFHINERLDNVQAQKIIHAVMEEKVVREQAAGKEQVAGAEQAETKTVYVVKESVTAKELQTAMEAYQEITDEGKRHEYQQLITNAIDFSSETELSTLKLLAADDDSPYHFYDDQIDSRLDRFKAQKIIHVVMEKKVIEEKEAEEKEKTAGEEQARTKTVYVVKEGATAEALQTAMEACQEITDETMRHEYQQFITDALDFSPETELRALKSQMHDGIYCDLVNLKLDFLSQDKKLDFKVEVCTADAKEELEKAIKQDEKHIEEEGPFVASKKNRVFKNKAELKIITPRTGRLWCQTGQLLTDAVFYWVIEPVAVKYLGQDKEGKEDKKAAANVRTKVGHAKSATSSALMFGGHYFGRQVDALTRVKPESVGGAAAGIARYAVLGTQVIRGVAGVVQPLLPVNWQENVEVAARIADDYALPAGQLLSSAANMIANPGNLLAGGYAFSPGIALRIPEVKEFLLNPHPGGQATRWRFLLGKTLERMQEDSLTSWLGYISIYTETASSWFKCGASLLTSEEAVTSFFSMVSSTSSTVQTQLGSWLVYGLSAVHLDFESFTKHGGVIAEAFCSLSCYYALFKAGCFLKGAYISAKNAGQEWKEYYAKWLQVSIAQGHLLLRGKRPVASSLVFKDVKETLRHKEEPLTVEERKLYIQAMLMEHKTAQDYIRKPTKHDGNELFEALALYVGEDAAELRRLAIDYIENHRGEFEHDIPENFDAYVARMKNSGQTAGETEMRALEKHFKRPVVCIGMERNVDSTLEGEPIFTLFKTPLPPSFLIIKKAKQEVDHQRCVFIDVPGNGDCFYFAFLLNMLIPYVDNQANFNHWFDKLFGEDIPAAEREQFRMFLRNDYDGSMESVTANPAIQCYVDVPLRRQIAAWARTHRPELSERVEMSDAVLANEIQEIETPHAWAGDFVIDALRRMFPARCIRIYQEDEEKAGQLAEIQPYTGAVPQDNNPVRLFYMNINGKRGAQKNHYQFLIEERALARCLRCHPFNESRMGHYSGAIVPEDYVMVKRNHAIMKSFEDVEAEAKQAEAATPQSVRDEREQAKQAYEAEVNASLPPAPDPNQITDPKKLLLKQYFHALEKSKILEQEYQALFHSEGHGLPVANNPNIEVKEESGESRVSSDVLNNGMFATSGLRHRVSRRAPQSHADHDHAPGAAI